MILTVTLNPSVDHALFVDDLQLHDTNRVKRIERDAGGKGVNVSRVIQGLQGQTLATGFLGGGAGAYVRSVLDRERVPNDFVSINDETRINFSVEMEDGKPPTCLNEPGPMIQPFEIDALMERIQGILPRCRWVVLGGSHPPGTPVDIFRRIGFMVREAGVPFALDADGEVLRLGLEAGPTLLKPNSFEASRLLNRPLRSFDDCAEGVTDISKMLCSYHANHSPLVVISRGERGAVMLAHGETWVGHPPKVKNESTVGSGDSMVAAMLTQIDRGNSYSEAFRHGLAAGAVTAGKVGSGLATLDEVESVLPEATVRLKSSD